MKNYFSFKSDVPDSFFDCTIEHHPSLSKERQLVLIQQAQRGDTQAVASLYLSSFRGITKALNANLGHLAAAGVHIDREYDELLDETFFSFRNCIMKYDAAKANGGSVYNFFARYQLKADLESFIGTTNGMTGPNHRHATITSLDVKKKNADGDERAETELDSLAARNSCRPDEVFFRTSCREEFDAFLDTCTEEERQVAELRMARYGGEEMSFEDIGKQLGTNKARAFYVFGNVCRKIKGNPQLCAYAG